MIYTPHHIKGNAHALWYKLMLYCTHYSCYIVYKASTYKCVHDVYLPFNTAMVSLLSGRRPSGLPCGFSSTCDTCIIWCWLSLAAQAVGAALV